MKKVLILCFLILTIGAMVLPAEDVIWGSYYGKLNIKLGIDADFEGDGTDSQVGICPEAEIMLWKPVIGSTAFIDIGAAARGRLGLPVTGGGLSAGLGVLGTIHMGFRGLELPVSQYLERLDIFTEVGIKFDFLNASSILGFAMKSGVHYFISDSMAVGAHYSRWGEYSGGGLSLFFKLGNTPVVKGLELDFTDDVEGFAVQPYLLQFYTLYYSAHFAGGFYPENFEEGQGCAHRISIIDNTGESSYVVEKAYIKSLSDDSRLWSLKYDDGEDSYYYEYITDKNNYIQTVYYNAEDEGLLVLNAEKAVNPEPEYLGWEDYSVDSRNDVSVDVEAGRFITTEYLYVDEKEVDVRWWISDDVPGNLVSYKMEDASDIVLSELIDISSRNKAKLYKETQ